MAKYYILIDEALYPTESTHDPHGEVYFSLDEAKTASRITVEEEMANFEENCGKASSVDFMESNDSMDCGGYIVRAKDIQDDWYFTCRIIEIESL